MLKTKYTNIQLLYKIKKKIGYGRIIVVSTIKKNNVSSSIFNRTSPLTSTDVCFTLSNCSKKEENIHKEFIESPDYCYYIITSRLGLLRCIHIYHTLLNKKNGLICKHNFFKTELKKDLFLKRFIK